jgi:hypothetical protein
MNIMNQPNPPEPATRVTSQPLTRYELLAKDVLAAVNAMMEEVPKLAPKERKSKAFIRTHIGISEKFVYTTVHGIEQTPALEQMNQMNIAAAYGTRQLLSAFRPVVSRLANVVEEMQLLLDTRQANAAAEALRVYAIVKALLHRSSDIPLYSIYKFMKRDLGRRGRPRKKRANAATAPAPRKKPVRQPRTAAQRVKRRLDRAK